MNHSFFSLMLVWVALSATALAQLENVVVELDMTGVTIPESASTVVVQVFAPGNAGDPMGPTPPNGDILFIGGNDTHSSPGFLASASCGLTIGADPTTIGMFPNVTYLIAVNDLAGTTVLSQGDPTFVEKGTSLACFDSNPDGDATTDDQECAENAYAREFSLDGIVGDLEVGSILVGVDTAIEGNNPFGGPAGTPPVFDGEIPVVVNFFFDTSVADITIDSLGPVTTPDVSVPTAIVVTKTGCLLGDVNGDQTVNLLDVAPFVQAIANSKFSCEADINEDGSVDLLDVGPFIDLLAGP